MVGRTRCSERLAVVARAAALGGAHAGVMPVAGAGGLRLLGLQVLVAGDPAAELPDGTLGAGDQPTAIAEVDLDLAIGALAPASASQGVAEGAGGATAAGRGRKRESHW